MQANVPLNSHPADNNMSRGGWEGVRRKMTDSPKELKSFSIWGDRMEAVSLKNYFPCAAGVERLVYIFCSVLMLNGKFGNLQFRELRDYCIIPKKKHLHSLMIARLTRFLKNYHSFLNNSIWNHLWKAKKLTYLTMLSNMTLLKHPMLLLGIIRYARVFIYKCTRTLQCLDQYVQR